MGVCGGWELEISAFLSFFLYFFFFLVFLASIMKNKILVDFTPVVVVLFTL